MYLVHLLGHVSIKIHTIYEVMYAITCHCPLMGRGRVNVVQISKWVKSVHVLHSNNQFILRVCIIHNMHKIRKSCPITEANEVARRRQASSMI